MTDEKTRAVLEEMRAFEKAHRLQGEGGNRSATEMADRLKRWGDTFEAALTVPDEDDRERLAGLIHTAFGLRYPEGARGLAWDELTARPDCADTAEEYRSVAEKILAAFPALSRAAAPGPLRIKFDGGRGAMLYEHDRIVGYFPEGLRAAAPEPEAKP